MILLWFISFIDANNKKATNIFSVFGEEANDVISDFKKANSVFTLKPTTRVNVLKFISRVIETAKKKEKINTAIPLNLVCFEFLISKYGLKKIAEIKLRQVLKKKVIFLTKVLS